MSKENENYTHQIKTLREMEYRHLDDCASFLDVSPERYKQIEENEDLVTLPEIELLSILFQTPTDILLKNGSTDMMNSPFNSTKVRQEYKKLRNKMILAKIEIACREQNISFQELLEKLNLPHNFGVLYEDGIPREHLFFICNELSLSLEALLEDGVKSIGRTELVRDEPWEQEFAPESRDADKNNWDDKEFENLVEAIKKIPKDEQALLARILLQELKEY